MPEGITGAEKNLMFLQSLIPAGEQIFTWLFDSQGNYIASQCPHQLVSPLEKAFHALGATEKAKDLLNAPGDKMPRIIGSPVGMQWAVAFETGLNDCFYIIGPVFYAHPDADQLRTALHESARGYQNLGWINQVMEQLDRVPVMSFAIFTRYVLLIHNTLSGRQDGLDILISHVSADDTAHEKAAAVRNRIQVYRTEQVLLQMVREGNINYQEAMMTSASVSPGVPVHGRDPLRQMKTSIIVFATLVTRAAMEGGLSPEIAYPLGDSYIQAAEDCRDSGELGSLANALYQDFIYRVHRVRSNPDYSHAVQKCCDYIELNLDKKLNAADLASLVGYTEYYLTDKFRKETGVSLSSYIRNEKIKRAKILLETGSLSIQEISEKLAFNTPNYFIQCFRNAEGCTPAQYRKKHKTQ